MCQTLQLACSLEPAAVRPGARSAEVAVRFGVPLSAGKQVIVGGAAIVLKPGQVVLVSGPSGSGKSTALAAIARQATSAVDVNRVAFPQQRAIIDVIAPWAPAAEAISLLTACGLGEARLWLRPYEALSDGEKFRARLARALAVQTQAPAATQSSSSKHTQGPSTHTAREASNPLHDGGRAGRGWTGSNTAESRLSNVLLCDEFGSNLHRRLVRAMAFNLRKLAERRQLRIVLAASNDDFADDLAPHTLVRLGQGGACDVASLPFKPRPAVSFRHRLRIVTGRKADYEQFAPMHYRAADELGFVDKVFVMREHPCGEPLGIVVYSHPPLELALRNQATGGWFSRNPARVNTSLRILRRVVIHPDVRGCGLAHHLIRKTLPRVGTEFVECLATMGEFNPLFEKAGMSRIGQYAVTPSRRKAMDELRALGVDPMGRDFAIHVCRKPKVRQIVARIVYDWYDVTTINGEKRAERQSPETLAQTFRSLIGSRPVYYLWRCTKRRLHRAAA